MPRLSDEVWNWHELSEADRELYRSVVVEHGMRFPDEEGDWYE